MSPLDVLEQYLGDRFEVERWAAWEDRTQSVFGVGGKMTPADIEISERIWSRIRELGDRYFSKAARARSRPAYGEPSEHDPRRNKVVHIGDVRRGRVEITVEYDEPGMPRERAKHTFRYDFKKEEGAWRLSTTGSVSEAVNDRSVACSDGSILPVQSRDNSRH